VREETGETVRAWHQLDIYFAAEIEVVTFQIEREMTFAVLYTSALF
jgi:hypothetical protein